MTPGMCSLSPLLPDLSKQPVQGSVVQLGDLAEGVGPLLDSLPDVVGNLVGQVRQLVHVGVQRLGECTDQLLAGVVAKIEPPVLDLAQVIEADADLRGHVT